MGYFILGIRWISHITISMSYNFTSSNLTSVIKQFNILYFSINILLYHYMKNLLPNIYLLNNKQDLNETHLNET